MQRGEKELLCADSKLSQSSLGSSGLSLQIDSDTAHIASAHGPVLGVTFDRPTSTGTIWGTNMLPVVPVFFSRFANLDEFEGHWTMSP